MLRKDFFCAMKYYYRTKDKTMVTAGQLFDLSISLLFISIWGIFAASHVIAILISLELFLLAIALNFTFFSLFLDDILGQVFALLILTIAGAESAIGLALLVSFYRYKHDISISIIDSLKA